MAYGDVLALKKLGSTLPIPPRVAPQDVHDVLIGLAQESGREKVKARLRAAGAPVYATDPAHPDKIVEIRADGTRTPGRLEGRRFVADPAKDAAATGRRVPLARVEGRRRMRLSGVTVAWRGTPNLDD